MDNISYFCGINLIYGDTNAQIISRIGSNCKRYRIAGKYIDEIGEYLKNRILVRKVGKMFG